MRALRQQRTAGLLLGVAVALGGCRASQPQAPGAAAAAPAGVVEANAAEARGPSQQRPVLSSTVLPSEARTVFLKGETAVLQRPKLGSAVLRQLPAGTTLTVLGELPNAEGVWLSVALYDTQGWVRAVEVIP